jgi:hypothetical protein
MELFYIRTSKRLFYMDLLLIRTNVLTNKCIDKQMYIWYNTYKNVKCIFIVGIRSTYLGRCVFFIYGKKEQ